MTEKEFRKLVSDVETSRIKKEEITENLMQLNSYLEEELSHFEIISMTKGGSLAKGTMLNTTKDVDFVALVKPRFTKAFSLVNKVLLNEIANALILKVDAINKISDIVVDEEKNKFSFKFNDLNVNLYIYYTSSEDLAPLYLKEDANARRIKFVELANKEYTYFRNAVQIIKYFKDEQKLTQISGYTLEVLLYYALKEYCFDIRYEDYLNAFLKGLDDFINGKKIEVPQKMYQELGVEKEETPKKGFMIMDVATSTINLTEDVNELKINDFRKLKKAISKLVSPVEIKDLGTGPVKLNVTPQKLTDNTYCWYYKIEDTTIEARGGVYSSDIDDYYSAIYKALLKGLKAIIDNNFNRKQVIIISPKENILTSDNSLSSENKARRKNVLAFMDNNQIKVIK